MGAINGHTAVSGGLPINTLRAPARCLATHAYQHHPAMPQCMLVFKDNVAAMRWVNLTPAHGAPSLVWPLHTHPRRSQPWLLGAVAHL